MTQSFLYPNLVAGTRASDGAIAYDVRNPESIPYEQCPMSPCGMAFAIDNETSVENYIFTAHDFRLRHGVDYTLSLWAAANENLRFSHIYILGTSETAKRADGWIAADKYLPKVQVGGGYVSFAFTLPEKSSEEWRYRLRIDNYGTKDGTTARLYVADVMLVEGTTPHAWAPAAGEVWP